MNDKLYQSIISGIAKMEALREDYKQKQADDFVLEVCGNMINIAKRAVARGMYPEKVEELKGIVTIMIEAQKHNNTMTTTVMAEEAIFEMLERLNGNLTYKQN